MSFLDEDAPDESNIAPEDVAAAARGCQAILVMLAIIAVLLCVAAVYYYGT